ncbi:MAG: cysteine rich repeat-containing protein [Deltaproteobacteria bacterium]
MLTAKLIKAIACAIAVLAVVAVQNALAQTQQKGPAEAAAQTIVETVAKGCEKELTAYCKDVTPGEGRVLACLYAHEDKLSGRCDYALYDAAAQLDRAVNAMAYVAEECGDDMDKYCADAVKTR